jgi:hypothetical protein
MKNLPFTFAVLVVVNEFVKNEQSFSAYEITKELRHRVGTEISITDPLPTDDNSGKTLIEHSAVRQTVHDAYETGLITNYGRQHGSSNGVSFWKYYPLAPVTTTLQGQTYNVHGNNGATVSQSTQTLTTPAQKSISNILSGDAEAKVRNYILNRQRNNLPVTIKGIQGMIFRRARISSDAIANEVGRMGFTVARQPGLKPSLALVK